MVAVIGKARLHRGVPGHLKWVDIVHCSFDFPLADQLQLEVLHCKDQYPALHSHRANDAQHMQPRHLNKACLFCLCEITRNRKRHPVQPLAVLNLSVHVCPGQASLRAACRGAMQTQEQYQSLYAEFSIPHGRQGSTFLDSASSGSVKAVPTT